MALSVLEHQRQLRDDVFKSCTTNTDMRLNESNLRTSSSASLACHLPRKAPARVGDGLQQIVHFPIHVDPALARSPARPAINSLPVVSGTTSHAFRHLDQPGRVRDRHSDVAAIDTPRD